MPTPTLLSTVVFGGIVLIVTLCVVSAARRAGIGLVPILGILISYLVLPGILGLGLLVHIVVIAVLSTPVPFRRFVAGPPNLLPSTFPYVWLPTFLVQVALASHLLVFRELRRPTRT